MTTVEPMQDPPTDDDWLQLDGRYIVKPGPDQRHCCQLPAEWIDGAVWRCKDGHLWVVDQACPACRVYPDRPHRGMCTIGLAWWPAGWWLRRRHGTWNEPAKRARQEMANENREQSFAGLKGLPPSWPSGVSPGPDGAR